MGVGGGGRGGGRRSYHLTCGDSCAEKKCGCP